MRRTCLIALFSFLLAACSSPAEETRPATRSAPSAAAAPSTPVPSETAPAPVTSTPSGSPLVTYDDKAAPFTIQYPRDWNIREEPESIFFTAPDESAMLQVITYEYLEGAPKNLAARDVLSNLVSSFFQGTGVKLTQQVTNADSSISANVEYNEAATRAPLQGFLRVSLAKNRRYHFIVLFSAKRDQFARYQPIGMSIIESFRER